MGSARFEETVVYHCSPALVGLKSACLISLAAEQYPGLASMVEGYRAALEGRGIRFELLCRCDRRFLLLVYHAVEEARRQFRRFDRCRDCLLARLRAGMTLSQLFGVSGTLAA